MAYNTIQSTNQSINTCLTQFLYIAEILPIRRKTLSKLIQKVGDCDILITSASCCDDGDKVCVNSRDEAFERLGLKIVCLRNRRINFSRTNMPLASLYNLSMFSHSCHFPHLGDTCIIVSIIYGTHVPDHYGKGRQTRVIPSNLSERIAVVNKCIQRIRTCIHIDSFRVTSNIQDLHPGRHFVGQALLTKRTVFVQ